ncbi:uncharacterized protein BJ212DRAFT_1485901 [Suillus subaureus]|uniref:DUF8190 domain-containing protein n=1 Tax=Suillus subaureus TaxID=48587 RepID=A0A9P7DZN5_9AGAM|nr:uncharacterized protein BJ212DRAFT_1485901 [Suillus subaureus]KAG1807038.1 hypothetical protein BJ212DRAFT_1485901 [Suillus subaureus]
MVSEHSSIRSDNNFNLDNEINQDATATSPFNLDDVPVLQEGAQSDGPTWEQTPITTLNLSNLERMFCVNDCSSAIKLLHHHVSLVFDTDLKLHSDNPTLLWQGSKHFLDFILVVSGQIGLHAFLPKTLANHNFFLTLNLCLQSCQFCPKFGKLGFDPTGSMMAISDGQLTELWFGFSPVANIKDINITNYTPLLNEKHGDTYLTSVHYCMGVMFLACLLSQIPSMAVHVMHPYGPHSEFHDWKIEDTTNMLYPDDLHSLPLHEPETQKEVNIYDEEGHCIPHLNGRGLIDGPKCSLLINLETIPQLFP